MIINDDLREIKMGGVTRPEKCPLEFQTKRLAIVLLFCVERIRNFISNILQEQKCSGCFTTKRGKLMFHYTRFTIIKLRWITNVH